MGDVRGLERLIADVHKARGRGAQGHLSRVQVRDAGRTEEPGSGPTTVARFVGSIPTRLRGGGIVLDDRGGSLDVSQCGLAGDGVELGGGHRRAAGGELVASV